MKKQQIGFILFLLICVVIPLEATATSYSISTVHSPGPTGASIGVSLSEDGDAAAGVTITFSITSGSDTASLADTTLTTGSDGTANTSISWTDGSRSYEVTISYGTQTKVLTIDPPAVLRDRYSVSVVSGPGSGDPGDTLTFTVKLQRDGSPVHLGPITFSITSGDGNASLSPSFARTDSDGQASTTVTLGSNASGSYTVKAEHPSRKFTTGTATVNTPPEITISAVSGPGSGDPGDELTFTVEVQEDGSAASGKTVSFSITSGDGNASLNPTSATTGSNGQASTTLTLGNSASGSYTITATVGDKSTTGTATVNTPPVITISVVSGPGSGDPGDDLTFTVEVQEDGTAASGKTVVFSITSGDGNASLNPTSATTGSNGQASTTLTLGDSASGSYTITATVGDESTTGTATVNTPPEITISAVSGPGAGDPGDDLTFTVEVQEDGTAASGKTVSFSITSGDGNASLSPTSATTGSNGQASTTLTLGNSASGSYTITATVGDKSTTGTATVNTPPEITISVVSGLGSGDPGDDLTFTVEVQEDGSAASGKTVSFSITSGDGNASLNPTSATTGSNGQASTTLTLGNSASGSYTITATVGDKSTTGTATVNTPTTKVKSVPEITISVVSGLGSGDPGDELTFTVEVQEDGSAASGKTVSFSITSGDSNASLNPASATTGSNGQASTTLTLGNSASGSYIITATVGDESTTGTATVNTPPVITISVVSGPGAGDPGDDLTFTVEVQEDGTAASGKTVTFSITSGDGNASLNPASATTDGNGQASTTLTLGNSASGSYTITATVGDKSTTGTATVNTPPVITISVVSGPGSGDPGDALTFTVEVQEDGSAASGKSVSFSITSGDGNASLNPTSATTGSNGQASTTLTLGNIASGSYTITATVGDKSTTGTATVNTPPVITISVVSGPGSGYPGDDLTFTVEVQEDGSAASGKTVSFSITSGDGNASLNPTSATTGSDGRASTTLTLGDSASGSYTITATVGDKSTTGTATVNTPLEITISVVSGPGSGDPGDALTFTVEVQEDGSAASGKTVTFSITSGDGNASLNPTSATTGSDGRASTTLTLGNSASGSYTITATVGDESTTGTATVNAQQARQQSGNQQQKSNEQQSTTKTPLPKPTSLESISGGNQRGLTGETLANPFVVEVRDQYDDPMEGVTVNFAVRAGGGSLNATTATTNANGRAQTTLTLGTDPGTNTVEASLEDSSDTEVFSAVASLPPPMPTDLAIVAGGDQSGLTGETLASPFVVEVRDQYDDPMEGVTVNFAVRAGGGSLNATTATTNANGRAQTTLTLGTDPGTNTVEASLEDSSDTEVFSAVASLPPPMPTDLAIVAGGDQSGLTGETLASPFVVEVRDQYDDPMEGVTVNFAVRAGGGTLSATSETTGANGRAETVLTLGPNPGTNTVEVGVTGISENQTVSAIAELPPVPEDVNGDNVVNILDLVSVASVLGDRGSDLAADVNGDGEVNILDLLLVAAALGNAAAAPGWDLHVSGMLTAADVREWLAQAGEVDLVDATSRNGVLFMEQFLAALTPNETLLLPNYPNPFNPETWIPYQLADGGDVRISVYDINGGLVRQLDIGYQRAGYYTDRSQAAYWDGRNDRGERVASGVYFYTLITDDFRSTRKMLVGK